MCHPKQVSDYDIERAPFWGKWITSDLDNVPTTTQICLSPQHPRLVEKESILCRAVPVVIYELSTRHVSWLCWMLDMGHVEGGQEH